MFENVTPYLLNEYGVIDRSAAAALGHRTWLCIFTRNYYLISVQIQHFITIIYTIIFTLVKSNISAFPGRIFVFHLIKQL